MRRKRRIGAGRFDCHRSAPRLRSCLVRNEFPQPFGPYELLRRLGRGGMAEVFLAKASTSRGEKRLVALKRMHQTLSEDQSAVAMLIEEARLCMRFHHDHIAQTFELGTHEGTWFFIMEYVDGVDLGTVANLAEGRNTRLDPVVVAYICAAMARGLDYAHELGDEHGKRLGIVHRDVSPQNVLIGRHGEVKLIDFGVAKVASRIQQTMAGIIKGKYAYMSPEQASAETVDQRSDVFSLGICMHELFAGRPLFRALGSSSPFAILRAVRDEPIPKVSDLAPGLPPELARIVHRALERDLKKRYANAGLLAQELEAWLQRAAPRFDATALANYVRTLVEQAPNGTLPQSAIATPPLAKMKEDEFEPSQMSVVAVSPLELAGQATIARAPPAIQRHAPPKPAPGARVPSMQFPREQFQAHLAQQPSPPQGAVPALALPPRAQTEPDWRPSRRATLQFLWVGIVALVFALGWSTIATLVKMGKL
jgi:serine/threonine protein kinase